jgi:AcrR family transcriptional regulator
MRSDASRNHEAILTSAIGVLALVPQASMQQIAEASGTGRTTLYRHFPDRASLIAAIHERVLREAERITEERLHEGSETGEQPIEVLADLAVRLAALGDRYRFLEQHPGGTEPGQIREHGGRLHDYLIGQAGRGAIRSDLEPEWLFQIYVALVTSAASRPLAEIEGRDTMLRATVRSLLRPAAG